MNVRGKSAYKARGWQTMATLYQLLQVRDKIRIRNRRGGRIFPLKCDIARYPLQFGSSVTYLNQALTPCLSILTRTYRWKQSA